MTAPGHLVARWSVRDRLRPLALLVLAACVVAAMTAAILRVSDPSLELAIVLPFLALVGVLAFLIPVHTLPSVALVVLALLPTRWLPSGGPFNALPPLAILLVVWILRRVVLGQMPAGVEGARDVRPLAPRFAVWAVAAVLAVWLVLSVVLARGGDTSIGWTTSFLASALLPLLVLDARAEARVLMRTFLVVGAIAGGYMLLEMLLGFSPLYGSGTREFEFSVYRARGAFAHPLFAGAFLTIPAALGIGQWLTTGRRWPLLAGALAAAGVVATVSRGSIAALGVAVGFALIAAPVFIGWRHVRRWFALLVASALAAVVVLTLSPLADRADSIESQLSAGVRERALEVAILAGERFGWAGTGPGTSGVTSRLFDEIVIENSLLQLLISVGIPGLALFLLLFAALAWAAWANRALGVVLALIAYVVAISGFNSIDAVRVMHVLIGFLVILALHASPLDRSPPLEDPVARTRRARRPTP